MDSEYIVRIEIVQLFENGAERVIDRTGSDGFAVEYDSDIDAVEELYRAAITVIA